VHRLSGAKNEVLSVSFSPDGRLALAGSWDKAAILWDVASGSIVHRWTDRSVKEILSVTFSPDGRTVLTGNWDEAAILWDASSGRIVRTLGGTGSVCLPASHLTVAGADGELTGPHPVGRLQRPIVRKLEAPIDLVRLLPRRA
jgi:WD40 repeat protein